MNVIFVKWGTKYSAADVNTLYNDLIQYEPNFTYHCYTEDPTDLNPGINVIPIPEEPVLKVWWNKLRMFSKEFPVVGKCMFFDIDTKINDNPFTILPMIDFDELTLINCPWKSSDIYDRLTNYDVKINSSVITWTAGKMNRLWDHFYGPQRDYFLRKYVGIDRYIVHEMFSYDTFHRTYVQSYKYQKEINYNPSVITYEEVDFGSINTK
jgi:hypothetical protein